MLAEARQHVADQVIRVRSFRPFERMLEEPATLYGRGIGSSYQQQEETLGKHFLPRGDDQLTLG